MRRMGVRLPRKLEYGWDLLVVLVLKELRVRYKRTALGYGWSIVQPLAFAAVYWVVFKQFIRIETEVDYTLFLVCGLFAWQWFGNAISSSTMALVNNGPLITKVSFPRVYAVLSGYVNDVVHYLLALPVVLGFVLANGYRPRLSWLWLLPTLLIVQGALVLGLSLLLATWNLVLRDLERLVGIGVLMLFHLTPVVYPETLVPAGYRWILVVNPMGSMVINWRDAWLHGRVDPAMLGASVAAAAVALAIGWAAFLRKQVEFAELV